MFYQRCLRICSAVKTTIGQACGIQYFSVPKTDAVQQSEVQLRWSVSDGMGWPSSFYLCIFLLKLLVVLAL